MDKNFKSTIGEIVREYDDLLRNVGLDNPNYEVVLDPNQAAGFSYNNEETKKAMGNLSPRKFDGLLTRLLEITEQLSDSYILDRKFFL